MHLGSSSSIGSGSSCQRPARRRTGRSSRTLSNTRAVVSDREHERRGLTLARAAKLEAVDLDARSILAVDAGLHAAANEREKRSSRVNKEFCKDGKATERPRRWQTYKRRSLQWPSGQRGTTSKPERHCNGTVRMVSCRKRATASSCTQANSMGALIWTLSIDTRQCQRTTSTRPHN